MSTINELVDGYLDIVQEQNVSEDLGLSATIAPLAAMGIVLGAHFAHIRKLKKAAKKKCEKLTGINNKKCLIRVDIVAHGKEVVALRKGLAKCGSHKNPPKCRSSLQGLIKDHANKIRELQKKMAAL